MPLLLFGHYVWPHATIVCTPMRANHMQFTLKNQSVKVGIDQHEIMESDLGAMSSVMRLG